LIPGQLHNRKKLLALAIALLAVLPGNMIWIALSGMETILFITLGLSSLRLYQLEKWVTLGFALGLFVLTRMEGVLLAGVLVMVEFIRRRRLTARVIKIILPIFVLLSPWLIYLQIREGVPITTSYQGRLVTLAEIDKLVLGKYPQFAWILNMNPLYFMICWTYFGLMYLTGVISIPSPTLIIGEKVMGIQATLPWVGLVVALLVCLPLIYFACKSILKARKKISLPGSSKWVILAIVLWLLAHNLAYALFSLEPWLFQIEY
jgi:hypothetical protein